MRFRSLITALVPLAFAACLEGSDPITYPNVPIEQTTFAASLNVNLAASNKTPSGLYYRDLAVGTGATATSTSKVSVYYTGYRTDGSQFDSRVSPPAYSPTLGQNPPATILGFEEGIVGMKVGGRRQLILPPSLAYGAKGAVDTVTGQYVILPNAVLVFTVELVSIP